MTRLDGERFVNPATGTVFEWRGVDSGERVLTARCDGPCDLEAAAGAAWRDAQKKRKAAEVENPGGPLLIDDARVERSVKVTNTKHPMFGRTLRGRWSTVICPANALPDHWRRTFEAAGPAMLVRTGSGRLVYHVTDKVRRAVVAQVVAQARPDVILFDFLSPAWQAVFHKQWSGVPYFHPLSGWTTAAKLADLTKKVAKLNAGKTVTLDLSS